MIARSQSVPEPQTESAISERERYEEIRRVTLVGSVLDLTLGIAKIAGGWLAGSQALIADGVHSLSDLVTDIGVIVAAKHNGRSLDTRVRVDIFILPFYGGEVTLVPGEASPRPPNPVRCSFRHPPAGLSELSCRPRGIDHLPAARASLLKCFA